MKTKVRCLICPKGCDLQIGEIGDCGVRQNIDGQIRCTTYNHPAALNVDPIEKKPLYHVLPGSETLSIGTAGCNLHCKQCQNWALSQEAPVPADSITPAHLTSLALEKHCPSIAYTYAEPLVSYEYTLDCCKKASEAGFKNILVTAAFINPDPLRILCTYVDAANVDIKSFSDAFYREVCDAQLKPVLNALKIMKECGVFIEITNLLIPTLNDSEDETKRLCNWIAKHLGPETPLHFSRFFPQHRLKHLPPTPVETLQNARAIAIKAGLQFVYVGNMEDRAGESTFCPGCETLLIQRRGYQVSQMRLKDGKCPNCGYSIHGIWH